MADQDNILAKWLEGSMSETEVKEALPDLDLVQLKAILDKQSKTQIKTNDEEQLWQNIRRQRSLSQDQSSSRSPKRWMYWFIALLLISAIVSFLIFNSSKLEVRAEKGETLEYALDDGSEVRLWPGSTIQFPERNFKNNRHIDLDGQAYFSVLKGSPFTVKGKGGKIRVLGTSFMIWDIDKDHMEVLCYDGRVLVENNRKGERILTAGQRVRIEDGLMGDVQVFDPKLLLPNGPLKYYENAKISWVIQDLEQWFDFQFDKQTVPTEKRFTGLLSTQDASKALQYLCETMNWHCDQSQETITIRE